MVGDADHTVKNGRNTPCFLGDYAKILALAQSRALFLHQKKPIGLFWQFIQNLGSPSHMLTFYHHPLSPISRRVWLALCEKEIPFTSHIVNLKDGEQRSPEFLALNPFHHVPVIVDGDLRLFESIAILDYLEAEYPTPSLVPETHAAQAQMKMVQMVTVNELMPKLSVVINADQVPLTPEMSTHIKTVLTFLNGALGDRPYFGGSTLNLADITVGATIPPLYRTGLGLDAYPNLQRWCQTIMARPAWVETAASDVALSLWKRWVQQQIQSKLNRQEMALRQNASV